MITDIKRYIIDFIEGKVNAKEFILQFRDNPQIGDYIQSFVVEGKTFPVSYIDEEQGTVLTAEVPYNIRVVIKTFCMHYPINHILTASEYERKASDLGIQLNIQHAMAKFIREAFPDEAFTIDPTIDKKFNFLLSATMSYIGGEEANELLTKVMDEIPQEYSKTKRVKLFRERIKELFHLESKKYPRWCQDPEWPVCNGRPMKFVSQKAINCETYEFHFVDVETGETKTVVQFY